MKTKALKSAFPHTLPVLTGYLFIGMAYGILLSTKGYHFGWAILMSTFIFAGSMQFVTINLLVSSFNMMNVVFMTLMINARHLFILSNYHEYYQRIRNGFVCHYHFDFIKFLHFINS